MDVFALLQTVAQVAITFAGLGAIASNLNQSSAASPMHAHQLRTMVESSLIVMILALAPCGLALFQASEQTLWRASAILAIVVFLLPIPGFFGRLRRVSRTVGFPWPAFIVGVLLLLATLVMFLLCAFGAPLAGNYAATYFAGLLPILIVEAILFSRLILAFLPPIKPD